MNQVSFADQTVKPSKIVCVGRNYVAHIEELGNRVPERPVLFIKPNSAIASEVRARPDEVVHYEGEIVLLINDGLISGVGFGLDLTRRALQAELKAAGLPWERAKAFDGAAVFSPFVPFAGDPDRLRLELWINDRLVQSGSAQQMLVRPQALLDAITADFSLQDGDLVMTGTPAGVGEVCAGDRYVGRVFAADELLLEQAWLVG